MQKTPHILASKKPVVPFYTRFITARTITIAPQEKNIEECFRLLEIPLNSKQEEARNAFLELAKKYHPDSGSPDANIDKFVAIETAFRIITKHNTGGSSKRDVEQIVYDIRHTAPQHRQYLSYEGVGYGTPFQRQKQYTQARAQRAATNVMEHRISKAIASENTLMKKGNYGHKHDIKTKYGFDRLVEDLIQESISKGEFENLSGKGKPLKHQNNNPYVDFTTHKLNEVLINNGFTPEWITMSKDIDQEIILFKEEIKTDRMFLGPYPLNDKDQEKWNRISEQNRGIAKSINSKINTFNLIVPLINKQKFHVKFDDIAQDILMNGIHSVERNTMVKAKTQDLGNVITAASSDDIFGWFFKGLFDLFSPGKEKKNDEDMSKSKSPL